MPKEEDLNQHIDPTQPLPVDHAKNLEEVKAIANAIAPFQEEEKANKWVLPVDRVLFYEHLQVRQNEPFNLGYDRLYLAMPAQRNESTGAEEEFGAEFTIFSDPRWPRVISGDLLVFFVRKDSPFWNQFPSGYGNKLLDRERFPYPSISQIKQRKI